MEVLERSRDNLSGRCRLIVDHDNDRNLREEWRGLSLIRMAGLLYFALGGNDFGVLRKEETEELNSFGDESAAVVTQVDDDATDRVFLHQ